MHHRMKIAVAGIPKTAKARAPVLAGRRIRLRRKILTLLFGPEEDLAILIPGRSVKDIQIKEERDEPC